MPILGVIASSILKVTGSYESIASTTTTTNQTSVTFSSIPSTYKYLQIKGIARANASNAGNLSLYFRFNGDTANNYSRINMSADGSGSTGVLGAQGINTASAQIFSAQMDNTISGGFASFNITIYDYAATTKLKTMTYFSGNVTDSTSGQYKSVIGSNVWNSTSAITSIEIYGDDNFSANSIISLYGIKGS